LTFFKRLIDSIDSTKKPWSDSDAIFTLSSAYISLEAKLNLKSTGRCGICVQKSGNDDADAAAAVDLNELKVTIKNLLDASRKTDFKLSYGIQIDTHYGQLWIIVDAKTVEDSVACITVVSEALEEMRPFYELQSAVFEFGKDGNKEEPFYLIYDYELDKFYPFVPIIGRQKARNDQQEINIMKAVEDDKLPFDDNSSRWYPKWNLPF
jgi:hypothetical protein